MSIWSLVWRIPTDGKQKPVSKVVFFKDVLVVRKIGRNSCSLSDPEKSLNLNCS